ncbi:PspC domain-containing protein, partial [candidate division KSB1 bacterium]|nr:PspC domain-containing protein [candidate division KSB1 bacterium]
SNKYIAGVAGGIAQWTGISSFWIRLLWMLLLLPGGLPGIIPYLVCWIVIPKEGE